jgi:predicted secreted protein
MTWISAIAVYFILWWIVLFAVLPFSLRTQDDADDVTLGTTASAPHGRHVGRAMLRATLASLVIFGILVLLTRYFGLGIDDIPQIVPDFN